MSFKSQVKSRKMLNLREVAQQALTFLCLTSCRTHGAWIRKAARALPIKSICPGLSWPSLCLQTTHPHISSLLFLPLWSWKESMWHRGGGNGGQELWALQGPAMLGISLLTHTDLHMDVNTDNLDLRRDQAGGSSASSAVLKTQNAPASLQIVGNPRHVDHI